MVIFIPRHQRKPTRSFVTTGKVILPIVLFLGVVLLGSSRLRVYARQGDADAKSVADQATGGITGYVVGSTDVAAYACPDVNTTKCPIKLTLKPGTVVLIIDNVLGSTVPGLNDNAWRKIRYQGLTLYVPLRYVSLSPSASSEPDVSLVQTSYEDDSTQAPNFPIAPGSASTSSGSTGYFRPCTRWIYSTTNPPVCVAHLLICIGPACPPGFPPPPPGFTMTTTTSGGLQTWYAATDGRIDGGAGDRIAIYCRRTGRIEVWSIHNSQGHFLVEFKHEAVDAAGKAGFSVPVGGQGVVAINGDGHGQYWAAIQGGPFNATGTSDFAKTFHCYQSS